MFRLGIEAVVVAIVSLTVGLGVLYQLILCASASITQCSQLCKYKDDLNMLSD
ncbi:hypothetical protein P691DRAFT_765184 [Macrolepiota fuliginosa MF-IS2]|uniref:Uncharacterized protein n=1 Tax=Macrolepiota fuliginosa MF-IS2 TaxID=1400762 RepID=A0A9P6BW44_9AGAR|nr:hypothetical protein P691DRAFT_765184 [Macrolepiota fuliginosa MF-IS2]